MVCGAVTKTALHLFKDCHDFRVMDFACKWGGKVNNWNYASVIDMIEFCFNPPSSVCGAEMDKDLFTSFFLLFTFWFLEI